MGIEIGFEIDWGGWGTLFEITLESWVLKVLVMKLTIFCKDEAFFYIVIQNLLLVLKDLKIWNPVPIGKMSQKNIDCTETNRGWVYSYFWKIMWKSCSHELHHASSWKRDSTLIMTAKFLPPRILNFSSGSSDSPIPASAKSSGSADGWVGWWGDGDQKGP